MTQLAAFGGIEPHRRQPGFRRAIYLAQRCIEASIYSARAMVSMSSAAGSTPPANMKRMSRR
jgi:hypothetical protein